MADPIVNFFKSTLVGTYSDSDTSITIATGDGALLPDPSTDGAFNLTIFEGVQVTGSTEFEIVRVTARSGDVLTVTRGAESTTPLTIGSATHSILMSATKKTFDDINTAIDNVDLTSLTGVEELTFDSTGDEEFGLPAGTTAQRPSSPSAGYMRYNTDDSRPEIYNGSRWAGINLVGFQQADLGVAQLSVTANDAVAVQETYTDATGGTTLEYDSGGKRYRSHTFTSDGTFTVTQVGDSEGDRDKVDYLIIGGGGGSGFSVGGGGGAGGYRTTLGTSGGNSTAESKVTISAQTYSVVVGAGGTGGTVGSQPGTNGSDSSALSIVSDGGGGGGGTSDGANGGSGGGAGGALGSGGSGGSATTNQGFDGGSTGSSTDNGGAGGGGASQVGSSITTSTSGADGGDGLANTLRDGTSETRAGGGGGGARSTSAGRIGGTGGAGGGGTGGGANGNATAGATNTGSGAGGPTNNGLGDLNGGSGIVILRYEIETT